MSDKIKNSNSPAFAAVAMCETNGFHQEGLTKREYFAAMAMQGILSSRGLQQSLNSDKDNWIEYAVKQADALLSELNKDVKTD